MFFDDKMAVVNAGMREVVHGVAMPLLLDLAGKPVFLYDDSVPGLDNLLDRQRRATTPHPFYSGNANERADLAEFLRGLGTQQYGSKTINRLAGWTVEHRASAASREPSQQSRASISPRINKPIPETIQNP